MKVFDEKIKEFIDKEFDDIAAAKERVAEEKRRIRIEIYQIYKIDSLARIPEQNVRLEFLQEYDDVLVEQYNLLCKRDIAMFQLIAGIGAAERTGDMQEGYTPSILDHEESQCNDDNEL